MWVGSVVVTEKKPLVYTQKVKFEIFQRNVL